MRQVDLSTRRRVLVVEDEAGIRDVVCELLEGEGYRVDAAENGRDALLAMARERPDVVLLDLSMPEMNGQEFYEAARRALDAPPPIVVMSASRNLAARCDALGLRHYLTKPFTPDALLAVVDRASRA